MKLRPNHARAAGVRAVALRNQRYPMKKILWGCLIAAAIAPILSCSMTKTIVRGAVDYMTNSREVFERETDLEIAKISLASNLKILETMAEEDPENYQLNLFLAETFSIYSLAFVEDEMDRLSGINYEESEYHKKRAIRLYDRASAYAYKIIEETLGKPATLERLSDEKMKEKIDLLEEKQFPALFWYAYSRAASMNLQKDDMNALVAMPLVKVMMDKIIEWNDKFYFGGGYLFTGMYYGARPVMIGGNAEKSRVAFEKALQISQRKILLIPYLYAKTYCVQFQDAKCFTENLEYVLNAPDDIYPEQSLANEVAKHKARRLLKKKEDLFFDLSDVP
ncbi:MAG: TRAP transporter TatT component family protein [Leptospirales bacterium]